MKKEEIMKQALFLTNTAYLLADMANSCAIDADSKLNRLGQSFLREEKMRFKRAAKLAKDTVKATREITEPLYAISDIDSACIDSDYLLEVVQLVINRTDDTEASQRAMIEHIKQLPVVEQVEVSESLVK